MVSKKIKQSDAIKSEKQKKIDSLNDNLSILSRPISRRAAVAAGTSVAVAAVAGLAIGGAVGYLGRGSSTSTSTSTVTETASGATSGTATVTETSTTTATTTVSGTGTSGGSIGIYAFEGNLAEHATFMANGYMAAHPGVTVTVTPVAAAEQGLTSLLTALEAPPPPDIIYNSAVPSTNADVVPYALELDSYAATYYWQPTQVTSTTADLTSNIQALSPSANFMGNQVNGHYYWFPMGTIYYGLMLYNKTIINSLNLDFPPANMADFMTACAAVTKAGYLPAVMPYTLDPELMLNQLSIFIMNALDPADYASFWGAYVDLTTSAFTNRTVTWNTPAVVAQWQTLADWGQTVWAPGITTMSDESATSLFSTGKAAFYTLNSEAPTIMEGPVNGSFEYGMFPNPGPPTVGGDGTLRQVGFILPYFVRSDTKYPALCADFLNSMLSPPNQEWAMTFGGFLPAAPMASWLTDPNALMAAQLGNTVEYAPSLASTLDPAIVTPVVNAMGSVLTGAQTAAQVCMTIENAAIAAAAAGQ